MRARRKRRGRREKEGERERSKPGDSWTWILLIFCRTAAPRHIERGRERRMCDAHNDHWSWRMDRLAAAILFATGSRRLFFPSFFFFRAPLFYARVPRDSGASSSLFSHSRFKERRRERERYSAARESGCVPRRYIFLASLTSSVAVHPFIICIRAFVVLSPWVRFRWAIRSPRINFIPRPVSFFPPPLRLLMLLLESATITQRDDCFVIEFETIRISKSVQGHGVLSECIRLRFDVCTEKISHAGVITAAAASFSATNLASSLLFSPRVHRKSRGHPARTDTQASHARGARSDLLISKIYTDRIEIARRLISPSLSLSLSGALGVSRLKFINNRNRNIRPSVACVLKLPWLYTRSSSS